MTDTVRTGTRRPSLHAVARAADVSVSTVSRYLNGQLTLSPETETRVKHAMDEVGYEPAPPAPARSGRTSTGAIALIVPEISNPYFGRIADAVVEAADVQGLQVLLASTMSHARRQLDYVQLLSRLDVDGILYAGSFASNRALSNLIEQSVPVVVIDETLVDAPPVDSVVVDDYSGSFQAVSHLIALGHRRVALVAGPAELASVRERVRGYRDAIDRAGIPEEDRLELFGPFSEGFGHGALSYLLAATPAPTAVFAASDTIAMGILSAARALGVKVPGDLSVVGFDDVPVARQMTPRLSTVHMPADAMASEAVRLLVRRIERRTAPVQRVVVPVTLVVGETAAPPVR